MPLTKDEVVAKYGDVPLYFHSYYKYTFHYSGTGDDGVRIMGHFGGEHDSVYRYSVDRDIPVALTDCHMVTVDNWDYDL